MVQTVFAGTYKNINNNATVESPEPTVTIMSAGDGSSAQDSLPGSFSDRRGRGLPFFSRRHRTWLLVYVILGFFVNHCYAAFQCTTCAACGSNTVIEVPG